MNDGIGVKEVGGSLQLLESSVVSELAAGKENLPGFLRRHVSSQNHSAPQFQVSEELKDLDITWDLDSLMRCVREGEDRVAFTADLEAAALSFLSDSAPLLEHPTPDRYLRP